MRRAGVLMHISSLPSAGPIGDLGPAAHRFVDWLHDAGCNLWQVLPLNPVGPGASPYASPSALASEPGLISLELLVEEGLLGGKEVWEAALPPARDAVDFAAVDQRKRPLLDRAADRFAAAHPAALEDFAARQSWAMDWARFDAARRLWGGGPSTWADAGLRRREPAAIAGFDDRHGPEVRRALALQVLFDRQWARLRAHADARGVQLVGDVPIFVSADGCDTWAEPELFLLDGEGRPTVRAGVPPDYFSPTGQLWGNPHYAWEVHRAQDFSWWKRRFSRVLEQVHRARVDHFRGFAAAWAVPLDAETAETGAWSPGPGRALFDALGPLPLIAEDLGIITPDVEALRQDLGAPGMKVLQFAFGDDADHPFLPHNFDGPGWVVYTGTHDNDTARGWYRTADEASRHRFRMTASCDGSDAPWDLVRLAWGSVASDAIAPMQDLLGLDSNARMNVPGLAEGNWGWRLSGVPDWVAGRLRGLSWTYGRLHEPKATKTA